VQLPGAGRSLPGGLRRAHRYGRGSVGAHDAEPRVPLALQRPFAEQAREPLHRAGDHLHRHSAAAGGVSTQGDLQLLREDDHVHRCTTAVRDLPDPLADVGRKARTVGYREAAERDPLTEDLVEHRERVRAGALARLRVGDQRPAAVAGDDLRLPEVPRRPRRLARAGGADQHHHRVRGEEEPVRSGRFPAGGDHVRAVPGPPPRAGGSRADRAPRPSRPRAGRPPPASLRGP
jgi:hypothetical protein